MAKRIQGLASAGILLLVVSLNAQDYTVKRESNGPLARQIGDTMFNEGSELERGSLTFNHPECPVMILANSARIEQQDAEHIYVASTDLRFNQATTAVSWTISLFDVFGRHIQDFERMEVKDYVRGWGSFPSTWNAEERIFKNGTHTELTTVCYITNVRLADGSVWRYDAAQLEKALRDAGLVPKQGN